MANRLQVESWQVESWQEKQVRHPERLLTTRGMKIPLSLAPRPDALFSTQ
jgi:hypothetical protein